jgi:hypothetical protein
VGDVVDATEKAIAAARATLTDADAGAVEVLRALARKIDTEDEARELALEAAADKGAKPPPIDNVSIPTYLKFCESLGLTPAGRGRLPDKKGGGAGGRLSVLRDGAPGRRSA